MLLTNWLKSIACKSRPSRLRTIRNSRSRTPSRYQAAPGYYANTCANTIENLEDRTMLTSILNIDDVSVIEGDAGMTDVLITVTRTGASPGDLNSIATVDFSTLDGTATTADSDYVALADTISFSAEASGLSQTETFTIQVNGDLMTEENETLGILLSNNTGDTTLGDDTAAVTILNDDQSTLTINDITVNEADGTASVVVSLDHPLDTAVSFDFSIFDETANDSADYLSSSGTLTFAAGEQSKIITVDIVDSDLVESTETFLVILSNIQTTSSSLVVSDTLAKVRILDDDQASLTIDDVSLNEDGVSATITVSLDKPVDTEISVDFATADQTAISTDDYTATSGTLIFSAGVQSQTITVPISDNNIVELDETFLINLFNLQANDADVIIGDDQATVTIQNDDQARISISDITVDENTGTAMLTVTLDQPVDTDVSIDFTTSDNTATDTTDYLATSGTLTLTPGMLSIQIPVSLVDSELVEFDESFLVDLFNIQASGRDVVFANSQAEVTIQDDQQAHLTIDDITVTEDESGGFAILTVSLDRPVDTTISVDYTTNDQSAFNTSDYTLTAGTLTFDPGEQSKTIMVPLVNDPDIVEGNETFVVDLTNLQGNGVNVMLTENQATVTILDDEQATLTIDDITMDENDPSGMAVLTVTLSQEVATTVTVDFTTADNTAFNTDDFTTTIGTLTFAPGVLTQTIMIPIIDDIDIVEGVESFFVNLSGTTANGANITLADPQGEVTILDNEAVTITIDDISVDENTPSGMAVLTVSLSQTVATTVTLDYTTADNTAINSEDYTSAVGTLTFAAGVDTQTIMVPIIDDINIVEGNESFFVNLSGILANGANISFTKNQGEVTILDDEEVSIAIDDVTVNEIDGTATLTVSLDQPVTTTVTVEFTTADNTAQNSTDYTAQTGTLTFNPGEQTQEITIDITDDLNIVEGDESFFVNLTNPLGNGANLIFVKNQGEVTIHDDETATISIDDVTVDEQDGTATFTVTLDQPVETDVSFDFSTSDLSAVDPADYTTLTNTFTFTAGQQSIQINVPIIDDDLVEDVETLLADLTNIVANGANITFVDAQGEITIQDNDQSILSINDLSVNEDLGTVTLTVSRNKLVDRTISVDYASSNDSALEPDDYTSTSGTLTFASNEYSKTITIPILIDMIVEANETFFVNLTNLQANGADVMIGDNQATVTILNDDQANLSIDDVTVNENDGTATLTVSLDKEVATTVTVDFATVDQSAVAIDDYAPQSGTLTFAPGVQTQTIIIDITNDLDTVEGDESFVINLTNLQANGFNVLVAKNQGTVTIEDDESATISISDETVNEGDGTVTLTVSLDQPVKTTVSVDYTTADLTAFSSSDYTAMTDTLTFAPDQQTATITIAITDDLDLVEVVEHFSVSLSNIQANGANITFLDNQADISIEDNDQASFSIDDVSINEDGVSATITVSLNIAVDTTISVDYATADQTATSADDYTTTYGTLTFDPEVISQIITVQIADNNIVELDETFHINLTNLQANGADVIIGDNQSTVTILNNDHAIISIDDVSEDEDNGTVTITVSLDQPVASTITVDFTTADLSAVGSVDYTPATDTLTFDPEVLTQTITIPLIDNELVEGDRTFQVSLNNLQNNGFDVTMGVDQATVTILDDDVATISINDVSIDEDAGMAIISVTLDKPVEKTVTVDYATADQTALDPDDYTAMAGTLTFFAGEVSHQIMVPIVDNLIVEGDETFLINLANILSNGTNVIFADNQAEVTILDNEQASFSINDMIVNEAAGTATLTVSLNLIVDTDISVDFTTFNLTAGSPDDYTAKMGTLEFFTGDLTKTITIDIIDDNLVEDDESLLVRLSNIQNGTNVTFADNQGTILIRDNDEALLSIQDTTVNEMEGTVSVTVSLDKPVDTTISVEYFTTAGSALDPDDFTSQSGTLTFNPGEQSKTIIIPLTNDIDIVEGDETFLINLINLVPNGAAVTIGDDQATVTIEDDETATISIDDMTVNENDGTATLTVSLDKPVATTVTVDYATEDQLALDPDDYTAQTGTLTFALGIQTQTIIIDITDDLDIVERIETFFVNLTNIQANGANITFADAQGEVTILDDEEATISIDDMTVNEFDGTATLTVTLDKPVATTVTVDFATQNQLAVDPDDYTAQADTLNFTPGVQTQTIIIDITDDLDIVEGIETFFVNLANIQANGANITFADAQGEVTILDDETATISIDDMTVNENDGTATLTVSLDKPVATTVTVDFATQDQLAVETDDYTAQTDTLTFAPGVQTQTITIDITNDTDIVEGIESFFVNLTNIQANGANISFTDDQGEVTILDDETATISIDDMTVNENDGTATLTVSLDKPVATTVTVDYATADQLAIDPDDYTAQTGTLTFNEGVQTQTIIIDITDDLDIVERIESFFVNLTNIQANGANITFADAQGEVTILDDETATISIDDMTVNEFDGTATLTVSLDKPVATTVTVDFATQDQLAVENDDYTAQADTLNFTPGVQTQTIIIDITDDLDIVEGIETFFVNLANIQANGANITFADAQGEVTILDDETATISIDDMTVNENDGTATLTVSLDKPVATTVTVDFATQDQLAVETDDYTAQTDTLTFSPGVQTQTITIDITNDTDIVEGIESFFVNLTNIQANGANISFTDDQGEVTILDDETATISIDDVTVNENDGTATLTVSLDKPVATTVTVDYATADQLAIDPDDYTAQTGTLTFNEGVQTQTIIIDITDDLDIVEGIESFFVNLTNIQANGANITFADAQGEVTILDDETATISIDDVTVNEPDGTVTLTVTLDQPIATTVMVDFTTAAQSAFAPNDYTAQNGTLTFAPGVQTQTITIAIINDSLVEGNESFLVDLINIQANGANITFADAQAEVTIFDDEQARFSINNVSVNEDAGTATLNVTLDKPVEITVSVDYATADNSADSTTDYVSQNGTLIFNAGEQTKTITVDIVDSNLVEALESFFVNLTNIQSGTADVIFADNQGEITIGDDDHANLTISDLTVDETVGTAFVTLSLDNPVYTETSVNFVTTDQTALNSIDFLFQSGSVTFNPGEQTKTIAITILDNLIVEYDELFQVNLSNLQTLSPNVTLADSRAAITIIDNDHAAFSISDITVNEDAGTVTLFVSLDYAVHFTISVDYATVPDSATNPSDYLPQTGTLIFTLGEQPQSITIPIVNTDSVELTERFFVNLTNLQAYGLDVSFADAQGEVTILDDDQTTLSIADLTVNEAAGTATVTVSQDQPVETSVSIDFATVDQSAFAPDDYQAMSGTLTFNAGEQTKTIVVPLVDSDLVELEETFLINLTNLQANGAAVTLLDNQALVTIQDDDQATISISDLSVDENAGTATLTVTLDQPVDTAVSVDFATADQSASDPDDYLATAGTLIFASGEQSKTITVSIIDSDLVEIDETFLVNLTNIQANGRNVSFADAQAIVTIIDDLTASAEMDLRVVKSPTTTQPNGAAAILPNNLEWIGEWSSYWVEIWVNVNTPTAQGVYSAGLDFSYQTEYTSATAIQFGASFTQNQSGSINDTTGSIHGLHAQTNASSLGIGSYLLFARIKFEPRAGDQVSLDLSGKSVGPYDLGFNISNQQVNIDGNVPVTTNLGQFDGVNIWANPFDLNDDDTISFRDLMLLASVYNTIPSASSSEYAWFADLNQNDLVDFKDLSLFVSNYGKSKLNHPPINYPQNFPDAWDSPLIVDTQTAPLADALSLTQSAADTVLDSVVQQFSPQLSPSENQKLQNLEIQVVDLKGDYLGRALPGTIYIDVNAAGYGWFIDTTPGDYSEFVYSSQFTYIALPDSDAVGRVDLWSVIVHEIGHILGHDHADEGVMLETLAPGVRNLPSWEINIEFDNQSTPEETDLFFFKVQDETELTPF